MKHYETKGYIGESTNYNNMNCVVDELGIYIVCPGIMYADDDEDCEGEPICYYAWFTNHDQDMVEFKTEEELDKFMAEYAEKLNAVERSKWVCLKRNAKRRLKKELASWVKDNAIMMGWPIKFFRDACLLAVSHYEVSIDEVMDKELMFNV
jgi:hypothetical protein